MNAFNIASSLLTPLFLNKLKVDNRGPCITVEIAGARYGFLLPDLDFWIQLAVILLINAMVCLIMATVIFKFILPYKKTATAYLMGFGMIIPLALYFPYWLINAFDIQNIMIRFGIYTPTIMTFHCLEAMYGTSPLGTEASLQNYWLYNCLVTEVQFSPLLQRPKQMSTSDLLSRSNHVIRQLFGLSLLYSLTFPYGFQPFDYRHLPNTLDHDFSDIFHFNHLANNLVTAILFYFILSFGQSSVGLIWNVLGYKTNLVMDNPFLESSSPSDFWGRRWNKIVQSLLKKGIYKPVRQSWSKNVASLATFVGSGLLHEYVWSFYFWRDTYRPQHGKLLLFFLWTGAVMLMEHFVGNWRLCSWMKRTFPVPVKSALVVLTALPMAHLFTGDLIEGDFFYDFQVGLPLIVKMK